jgi:hypothetical protein
MIENRKEYKFKLNKRDLNDFFTLNKDSIKPLYKERVIKSLYMDTEDFYLFHLSNTSDVEKYKLRFRQYNDNKKIFKEVKQNTREGRKKEIQLSNINNLNNIQNIVYKSMILKPATLIKYNREYYSFRNSRITVDSSISYYSTKNRSLLNKVINCNFIILEYKLLSEDKDIEKDLFGNPISFSKYSDSIEKLYYYF